ncbi:MAG: helix-turn-helix transcriptional regulator [Vicinamibacterales bacterium]
MKIRSVTHNNRNKTFALRTSAKALVFPYSQTDPVPTAQNPVRNIFVDDEAGREAFTYVLDSGASGTVHIEHVLEYNRDPRYLRDLLLYRLTIEAQKRASASPLSKREIIRRLGTSAAQLYRLLDQTNYRKSIDQLLALLQVLNCEVDLVVRTKRAGSTAA